jgi:hypothetical protein
VWCSTGDARSLVKGVQVWTDKLPFGSPVAMHCTLLLQQVCFVATYLFCHLLLSPSNQRVTSSAQRTRLLLCRYAIGQLYNPASRTVCGLQPAHFVTLATPHCGCDADGVAQVSAGRGGGRAAWVLAGTLH